MANSEGARQGDDVAPQSRGARSSRLEAIISLLKGRGYDQRTSEWVSQPQRDSSARLYDHQWDRFTEYCRAQKWDPLRTTSQQLAAYFITLFTRGLAPATVQVHRAAISSVLSLSDYDPGDDEVLRRLFRRFNIERPRTTRTVPAWDLSLVLSQMMKPPFVQGAKPSDRRIPLNILLYKTTFLLALASGARRGELHALSRKFPAFQVMKDKTSAELTAVLRPVPGFLAKTQLPQQKGLQFQIPGMTHLVPGEPERLLCPVRALQIYVKRTNDPEFLQGRERLLLHYNPKVMTTKASHVSQWIVDAIVTAYKHAPQQDVPLLGVKAHETRAVAHSIAYFNNASLTEVMEGARWKQASTFAGHYLRDMTVAIQEVYQLAPMVAAGRIVLPQDQ